MLAPEHFFFFLKTLYSEKPGQRGQDWVVKLDYTLVFVKVPGLVIGFRLRNVARKGSSPMQACIWKGKNAG